jgi:hypothetical protein
MAANTVTYFGDVTTVGNTVVFQNLTSQGNYSIFSGNVSPPATGTGSIGTTGALFVSTSNTTTLNVTSLYGTTGFIGLNTAGGGATLNVDGNAWTSNALAAQNVFALTSINVATLNTSFIQTSVGILNDPTTGATLNISGNTTATVAFSGGNVLAVTSANAAVLNTAAIFGTSNLVGINTTASGATLNVAGNVYTSNSLSAPNVFATVNANVASLNTASIFGTTGLVGINTTGAGARLNVAGNVYTSNSLAATNVFAITSANLESLNTASIFGTARFVGINATGGGATLNVLGNIYVSNGLATTNVLPTMNANIVTMNVTSMNLITFCLGINTPGQVAPAPLLKVADNVWSSNAFQSPFGRFTNVLAETSNLGPSATKRIFSPAALGIIGVGQVPTVGSATLQVTGNLFAANAFQSASINASTSANVDSTNVLVITNSFRRVGVNKGAPTANLDVSGNVFASNALQSANINVSTSANVTTLNTSLTITNSSLLVGINNSNPTSNLSVSGNVYVANTIIDGSVNQNLPVVAFTGSGPGGNVYTSVTGGVTYAVNMQPGEFETPAHPAWRAFNFPTTSSGATAPSKFILFEGESLTATNQTKITSPNGRYTLTFLSNSYLYIQDSVSLANVWDWNTIGVNYTVLLPTTITLLSTGVLTAYNAAGSVVYTIAPPSGYGPYRLTLENTGALNIYDRYDAASVLASATADYPTFGGPNGSFGLQAFGSNNQPYTLIYQSCSFTIPKYTGAGITANVYVVGGGGAGGSHYATANVAAGGGGGGGVRQFTNQVLAPGTYTITIGERGEAEVVGGTGRGGNTSISGPSLSVTSQGGGSGASDYPTVLAASSGGSGGGGSSLLVNSAGAVGTSGQGLSGGAGFNDGVNFSGGGGGGYAGGGGAGTAILSGAGGNGIMPVQYNIPIGCGGGGGYYGFSSSNVSVGGTAGGVTGGGGGGDRNDTGGDGGYYGNGGGGGYYGGYGSQGCVLIEYTTFGTLNSATFGFSSLAGYLPRIYFSTTRPFLPTSVIVQAPDFINSYNTPRFAPIYASQDGVNYTLISSSNPSTPHSLNADYDYTSIQIPASAAYKYFAILGDSIDEVSFSSPINQIIIMGKILAGDGTWTSNSITLNVETSNILTIAGGVGINTSTGIGATLQIEGNVYATDTLTGTIRATLANVATTSNIRSIFGTTNQVGINTATGLGANIHISGNVFASNTLSGNIRTPLANVTTSKVRFIFGTSGQVGINTDTGLGATLQIPGNVWASNTLVAPNVTVATILGYNEDLTRRSPYLVPSSANVTAIENWIAASCNTTQKVGWSVASTNVTFNTSTVGVTGSALYASSVLGPDGRVYFTPASATNIGVFNPKTNEFSTIVPVGGASLAGTFKYGSAVLAPNGNIFFISNASTTSLIFNPINKTANNGSTSLTTNFLKGGVLNGLGEVFCPPNVTNTAFYRLNATTGATISSTSTGINPGYTAAVLTPTGNVVCIPSTDTRIRVVSATALIRNTNHNQTTPAYAGGVLVPDGNVVCVPYSSLNATLYDPVSGALTQVVHGCGAQAFSGGVLLPTGNVVFVPFNASNVGMFNPVARTYSNLVSVGAVAGKYSGGTLLPDGRVVMTQFNASNVGVLNTRTPVSVEFCRSPYFNKY